MPLARSQVERALLARRLAKLDDERRKLWAPRNPPPWDGEEEDDAPPSPTGWKTERADPTWPIVGSESEVAAMQAAWHDAQRQRSEHMRAHTPEETWANASRSGEAYRASRRYPLAVPAAGVHQRRGGSARSSTAGPMVHDSAAHSTRANAYSMNARHPEHSRMRASSFTPSLFKSMRRLPARPEAHTPREGSGLHGGARSPKHASAVQTASGPPGSTLTLFSSSQARRGPAVGDYINDVFEESD